MFDRFICCFTPRNTVPPVVKLTTTIQNKNLFGKTINVVLTNIMSYDLGKDECKLRYELRFRDPNRECIFLINNLQLLHPP